MEINETECYLCFVKRKCISTTIRNKPQWLCLECLKVYLSDKQTVRVYGYDEKNLFSNEVLELDGVKEVESRLRVNPRIIPFPCAISGPPNETCVLMSNKTYKCDDINAIYQLKVNNLLWDKPNDVSGWDYYWNSIAANNLYCSAKICGIPIFELEAYLSGFLKEI